MGKKKKRGRPFLPKSEVRNQQVYVRLTEEEMALVRRAAGENIGAWAREQLLKAARRMK